MKTKLINSDCLKIMKNMLPKSVAFTLTDIPYDAVNRSSNGLRNLDKKYADVITFDLNEFLEEVYSQDLSGPIQNQIRQTARVVYDYLKRLDEVK